jgi:hypothetical protein
MHFETAKDGTSFLVTKPGSTLLCPSFLSLPVPGTDHTHDEWQWLINFLGKLAIVAMVNKDKV